MNEVMVSHPSFLCAFSPLPEVYRIFRQLFLAEQSGLATPHQNTAKADFPPSARKTLLTFPIVASTPICKGHSSYIERSVKSRVNLGKLVGPAGFLPSVTQAKVAHQKTQNYALP